jgi:hypothetical protein
LLGFCVEVVTPFQSQLNHRQHISAYRGIIVEAMAQEWTEGRLDDLSGRVDRGFAQVDQRFEQVDHRFDRR